MNDMRKLMEAVEDISAADLLSEYKGKVVEEEPKKTACSKCNGTGKDSSGYDNKYDRKMFSAKSCKACSGYGYGTSGDPARKLGKIKANEDERSEQFQKHSFDDCSECDGTGNVGDLECGECAGSGIITARVEEAGAGKPGPKTFQQRGERSMSREQWKELLRLVNVAMDEAIDRAKYDEEQDKCQLHKQDRNNIAFHFIETWDRYNLENAE